MSKNVRKWPESVYALRNCIFEYSIRIRNYIEHTSMQKVQIATNKINTILLFATVCVNTNNCKLKNFPIKPL